MEKATVEFKDAKENNNTFSITIASNDPEFINYTSSDIMVPEVIVGAIKKISETESKITFTDAFENFVDWKTEVERIININLNDYNKKMQKKEEGDAALEQAEANIAVMMEIKKNTKTWAKDYDYHTRFFTLCDNLPYFKAAVLNGDVMVYEHGIYVLNPDDRYKTGLHIDHQLESQLWDFDSEREAFNA